jgi:hypothetical protein
MRKDKKLLALSITIFAVVLLCGFLMLGGFGLTFFNLVFGWEAYTVDVGFNAVPAYNMGKVASVSLSFDISVAKEKVPIEALATGYHVHTFQGDNIGSDFKLHILVYVLNRVKLFDRTLSFEDLNPRQIKIYLQNVPAEAKQFYVEIDGSYTLNGEEIMFSNYGGAYALEA